ncbi:hypothetical protein DSUL_260031 [Desulfovibrionales bacterium]
MYNIDNLNPSLCYWPNDIKYNIVYNKLDQSIPIDTMNKLDRNLIWE